MKTYFKPDAYKNINSSQMKLVREKQNETYYQYYYDKFWNLITLKFMYNNN